MKLKPNIIPNPPEGTFIDFNVSAINPVDALEDMLTYPRFTFEHLYAHYDALQAKLSATHKVEYCIPERRYYVTRN